MRNRTIYLNTPVGPCKHCRAGKHYVCWVTPCKCEVCDGKDD